MKGLLVRVGADQSQGGGHWNGPVDLSTGRFCYVPIPESKQMRHALETPYERVKDNVASFGVSLPSHMAPGNMHLDPDFKHLTYGDRGAKGKQLVKTLATRDFIAFYSGLRDTTTCDLVYALIGIFFVDRLIPASAVPPSEYDRNAHTRRILSDTADDVIVIAKASTSGRLQRCIQIGEYRAKAWRVREDLLTAWGGISSNDGYIQRSAVFPSLTDPARFLKWFYDQNPTLAQSNN